MIALTIAAALVTLALLALVSQRRTGRGSTQFVLRVLPAALLLLVMPVFEAAFTMVRGFQRIRQEEVRSNEIAAEMCAAVLYPALLGSLGFLAVLCAAAFLQRRTAALHHPAPTLPEGGTGSARAVWYMRLLVATSLLGLPAGYVAVLPSGLVSLVVNASRADPFSAQQAAEATHIISARIIILALAGGNMSALLVVAAAFSILTFRTELPSKRLATYSWAVLAVAGVAVALNAVRLAVDIRAIGLAR